MLLCFSKVPRFSRHSSVDGSIPDDPREVKTSSYAAFASIWVLASRITKGVEHSMGVILCFFREMILRFSGMPFQRNVSSTINSSSCMGRTRLIHTLAVGSPTRVGWFTINHITPSIYQNLFLFFTRYYHPKTRCCCG